VPLAEPFSERAAEEGSAAMFVHVFAAASGADLTFATHLAANS